MQSSKNEGGGEKDTKEGKKKKEKADKQKAKERRRKELQKTEKRREAQYVKQERLRFFPKKVYKVTLLLEGTSLDTPNSSRRGSVDEITLAQSPELEAKGLKHAGREPSTQMPISLLLSYVTKEAGWTPRYDLKISSQQKTATIVYRTEFLNRTSETWKDAKLSFSTSQTSYQGLDDVVPFMHAWRIKLARYNNDQSAGLLSPEEAQQSRTGRPVAEGFNRANLFRLDDNFVPAWQSQRSQLQQGPTKGGLFSNSSAPAPGGGLFGSSNANAPHVSTVANFGSHAPQARMSSNSYSADAQVSSIENVELSKAITSARSAKRNTLFAGIGGLGSKKEGTRSSNERDTYDPTIEDTASTVGDQLENIEFEESTWEDSGLTATYDVPGTRTLIPSSETRRHKIASLNASKIHLSHISVPKLRSAAFLRAKIRNPSSSVTLLKGSAGVTLDGSFLGNMTLPRVSPGQVFDLPLGVDPAIHINYPKPSVHRSTQGIIFNKESAQVFTRSIWLNNTKSQPVELLVLDQIPVSEDERLRIVITAPKGLSKEGDKVAAGVSAKEGASGNMEAKASSSSSSSSAWGNAVAKMKKNGEINWTVNLEKGQGCLLKLDYEARLPPAEKIVPA